jgi:hypothetical protein
MVPGRNDPKAVGHAHGATRGFVLQLDSRRTGKARAGPGGWTQMLLHAESFADSRCRCYGANALVAARIDEPALHRDHGRGGARADA